MVIKGIRKAIAFCVVAAIAAHRIARECRAV